MEKCGGICDCQCSRDTLIYAASVDSRAIEQVVRLLGDVTLRPTLKEEEVTMARKAIQFELETLGMRPEQEPILMDMIHAAAYRDNTLGLPKLCPVENLDAIDRNMLMNYLKYHHTPKRMVIAGVGVSFYHHITILITFPLKRNNLLSRLNMRNWKRLPKSTL